MTRERARNVLQFSFGKVLFAQGYSFLVVKRLDLKGSCSNSCLWHLPLSFSCCTMELHISYFRKHFVSYSLSFSIPVCANRATKLLENPTKCLRKRSITLQGTSHLFMTNSGTPSRFIRFLDYHEALFYKPQGR